MTKPHRNPVLWACCGVNETGEPYSIDAHMFASRASAMVYAKAALMSSLEQNPHLVYKHKRRRQVFLGRVRLAELDISDDVDAVFGMYERNADYLQVHDPDYIVTHMNREVELRDKEAAEKELVVLLDQWAKKHITVHLFKWVDEPKLVNIPCDTIPKDLDEVIERFRKMSNKNKLGIVYDYLEPGYEISDTLLDMFVEIVIGAVKSGKYAKLRHNIVLLSEW